MSGKHSDDISGYNKEEVEELRDKINSTAQQVGENVIEELENGIIKPISLAWYAEEAQEYFETFAEQVKAKGETIREVFDDFRSDIEKAGVEWAEKTKGAVPHLAKLDDVELKLDVSSIKKIDALGNRGLNEYRVQAVVSGLDDVEANIKSNLSSLADELGVESAFLGHGQAKAIQSCFVNITSEIHKIFEYLLLGDDSLSGALKKYSEKDSTTATDVAVGYNSVNID